MFQRTVMLVCSLNQISVAASPPPPSRQEQNKLFLLWEEEEKMCSVIRSLTASRGNRKDSHQKRACKVFVGVCAGACPLCCMCSCAVTLSLCALINCCNPPPISTNTRMDFIKTGLIVFFAYIFRLSHPKYKKREKKTILTRSVKHLAET